jgi:CubicO group peptidase (beta-lactamase class C family)
MRPRIGEPSASFSGTAPGRPLFWVDPANDLAAVFLVQRDPFDGTLHHDIRKAVYGADYLGPSGDEAPSNAR